MSELAAELDAIDPSGDPEAAHCEADRILLAAAPDDVRRAYERLERLAPWWASA